MNGICKILLAAAVAAALPGCDQAPQEQARAASADYAPVKVERELMEVFAKKDWTPMSQLVIWHGRRRCHARKPACGACTLARWCPSYGEGPTDPEVAAALVKTQGRA